MKDARFCELKNWILAKGYPDITISPLAGDASFRRYFRVLCLNGTSLIAMDAPPGKEDINPFVAVANAFQKQGVHVPIIHAYDSTQGFMLLEDFGDNLYLRTLSPENADTLYKNAIHELIKIQSCRTIDHHTLPYFDRHFMMKELLLFQEWVLERHLNLKLSTTQKKWLNQIFIQLIEIIEQQPLVCVHRDYHSRNLIWCADQKVGVLDFQDAVLGPISYDLVSLLKDCYIDWPIDKVREWSAYYFDLSSNEGIAPATDFETFFTWFNCMGIQRHLKAAFIFARLNLLYGKPGYLGDIPRTMDYVKIALTSFPELEDFSDFLQEAYYSCI